MSGYRPEFEAALRLFGRVSEAIRGRGYAPPVLVGGAAVELYSNSAVMTGDFDIVTPRQVELEEELTALGFTKPEGAGHTPLGWVHPELRLGFEVVARTLFDGMADHDRIVLIDLDVDGVAAIVSVEDLIADRMGQYASGAAPEMLEQARRLYSIHPDVDRGYMDRRIRHESAGEYGLVDLES
jgi:hypothetical protein